MSLVAGKIEIIVQTFPQFSFFTHSWLLVPFAILSFSLIYILLMRLLQWYFEKPLAKVVKIVARPIAKGTKATKNTVVTSVKSSTSGAKKAVRKTVHGTSTAAKAAKRGVIKVGTFVKNIILSLIRKPISHKTDHNTDSSKVTHTEVD
jgi:hypothetical protein